MQQNVTYLQLLKNKRATFCLFTLVMAQFFSVESYLTKHLKNIRIDPDWYGYIFGLFAFMYMLMAFLVGSITKIISSRMVSFLSLLVIAIGCVLIGPISPIKDALENSCNASIS
jgi:MFS family permease